MRVFAILPFSAAAPHGGAAILRDVLAGWRPDELVWHDLFGRGPKAQAPGTQSSSPWLYSVLASRRLRPFRDLAPALISATEIRLLVPRLVRAIRSSRPDKLLLYGHTTTLHIYEELLNRVDLPYHVTVHDCPLIHMEMPSAPPTDLKRIEAQFADFYRNATSRDVISDRMRRTYLDRFGKDAVVITKGIDRDRMPTGRRELTSPVNIVMGGAGFRDDLWPGEADPIDSFFNALKIGNARSDTKKFNFHSFDATVRPDPPSIQTVPWMPQAQYDRFLERMHFGYAYDMLTPVGRRFAATSFPTKVVNYICRGLPFIYHGPASSTVADLLAEYPCGVLTDSHDPEAILAAVDQAIERYDELQEACKITARTLYDRAVIGARFRAALGAETERPNELPVSTAVSSRVATA